MTTPSVGYIYWCIIGPSFRTSRPPYRVKLISPERHKASGSQYCRCVETLSCPPRELFCWSNNLYLSYAEAAEAYRTTMRMEASRLEREAAELRHLADSLPTEPDLCKSTSP